MSLSGVPRERCAAASSGRELDRRGVPLSLLFAPAVDGAAQPAPVLDWVPAAGGDAVVLHGLTTT